MNRPHHSRRAPARQRTTHAPKKLPTVTAAAALILKAGREKSLLRRHPWVFSGAVSAVAVAGLYLYLYRTRLGMLTRAVMVSRDEALATGIDVHRVSALAFGIALGLAGIAGVFAPFMLGSITPAMGPDINLTAFAVIVVGTLGNPLGTVAGGVIYGVALMLMQTYYSSWASLLPNLLLIAVLLVRPEGLFGRKTRRA